ncbi:ABC transporter substrate-binding protein [Tenacibaculum ovolyticum]|uniref:ABC transporter substrate-binding protein n=1 Tax=Tenacibaculum ovolyticum TaxID=104270 RepID=UPI00041100BE|nr:helical backbone metal receptor [Tenacibaculum ovolyticum]
MNKKSAKSSYKRIISLVPSQTELLVDLGLEDSIIGVTKFCIHPSHLINNKTIVGGTKTIKLDKIKGLNPDIILCNKEENTKEIVKACLQIAPTHVSDIFTLDDSKKLIKEYGDIFYCKTQAQNIIKKLDSEILQFQKFIKNKRKKTVAYFIWKNPWMVAANNTFINHLIELNNFKNIYKNLNRYPEIELQDIKKENPNLILLSSEPFPFKEKHINEMASNDIQSKIILVDGEMFSWYGSRLLKAFDYFKKLHNSI